MLKPSPRHLVIAAMLPVLLHAGSSMAHEQATFEVTITNTATDMTLKLPDGSAIGAPIAPGAFAVVAQGVMPFSRGQPAGAGGIEALAEDGNADPFIAHLKSTKGVRQAGLFIPGQSFEVTVRPDERLVFASMFVQSNDVFLAPDSQGIALFDAAKRPIQGDVTDQVMLWDAGTETNEQPGAGPNQAPRQAGANTGPAENGAVRPLDDGFPYPTVGEIVRVGVRPQ